MAVRLQRLALRAHQLRFLVSEVRGIRGRFDLIVRAIGSRLAPRAFARRPKLATARIRFRRFELEFRIGEGEILNYEPIVRDLERGILPSGPDLDAWTIVDCGANIGIVSLFLSDARRIVAIEPEPGACGRLRRNLAANGVRATVIEKALAAAPGTVRMDRFGIFSRVSEHGALAVEATTLDEILDQHGIESVDLLKVDVEGQLFAALTGARLALERRAIRRICAEYIGCEELGRLDATLIPLGFARVRSSSTDALYELEPTGPIP